ncbi:hypothetical protein D3C80_1659340 [compost metagenome]
MLAPQQAAIAPSELSHRIRDRSHQCRLGRILHVQDRAHMEDSRIDVPEHAVSQAEAV